MFGERDGVMLIDGAEAGVEHECQYGTDTGSPQWH